jgi:uncharacterized protein YlxW (UPF0749 family)
MNSQEYIATGKGVGGDQHDFRDFLEAAAGLSDVQVKRVGARYVVIEADERAVGALRDKIGFKYEIAPNTGLSLY